MTALETGWKARSRQNRGIVLYRVLVDRESWKPTLQVAGNRDGKPVTLSVEVDPDVLSSEIATERTALLFWDTGFPKIDPLASLYRKVS